MLYLVNASKVFLINVIIADCVDETVAKRSGAELSEFESAMFFKN